MGEVGKVRKGYRKRRQGLKNLDGKSFHVAFKRVLHKQIIKCRCLSGSVRHVQFAQLRPLSWYHSCFRVVTCGCPHDVTCRRSSVRTVVQRTSVVLRHIQCLYRQGSESHLPSFILIAFLSSFVSLYVKGRHRFLIIFPSLAMIKNVLGNVRVMC
jgi:hypothetical protein